MPDRHLDVNAMVEQLRQRMLARDNHNTTTTTATTITTTNPFPPSSPPQGLPTGSPSYQQDLVAGPQGGYRWEVRWQSGPQQQLRSPGGTLQGFQLQTGHQGFLPPQQLRSPLHQGADGLSPPLHPAPAPPTTHLTPTPATATLTHPFPAATTQDNPEGALTAHNTPRLRAHLPPLTWSATLAAHAQTYAEELARTGRWEHSSGHDEGENLYWCTTVPVFSPGTASSGRDGDGTAPRFDQAVADWMSEAPLYRGEVVGQGGDLAAWGHYTQVMWRGTRMVGMGRARRRGGGWYVVARYWPAGNVRGQRPF